jgi:hypothetical protein
MYDYSEHAYTNPAGYYYTSTLTSQTYGYFEIQAWSNATDGTQYNTYAAAYAASQAGKPGVYVGDSGVFTSPVGLSSSIPPSTGNNLDGMPAVVLRPAPTPEPSTLLMTAAGLVGLLAYAWRKRRQ